MDLIAGIIVFVAILLGVHYLRKSPGRGGALQGWLRERFGEPVPRDGDHELDRVALLSLELPARDGVTALDERTWADLHLDAVFARVDRTVSWLGAQWLYDRMRRPAGLEDVAEFDRLVTRMSDDVALRERVAMALEPLDDWGANRLYNLFTGTLPAAPPGAWIFQLLPILLVAAMVAGFFWPLGFLVALLLFGVNSLVKSAMAHEVDQFVPSIRALPLAVRAAERLAAVQHPALDADVRPLREALPALRTIGRAVNLWSFGSDAVDDLGKSVTLYLSNALLLDINAYVRSVRLIQRHRDTLQRVHEAMGRLDSAIAVASFRASCHDWCRPTITAPGRRLRVRGLVHPLLATPVANDAEIDGTGLIVTGSNMSGKSTFIRALGVNAVLARTLGMCLATSWESPKLAVRSSIGRSDDLEAGKSYYLAEVESVRELLRAAAGDEQYLLLIDEIFRGTNTIERIAAGHAILAHLANEDDIVVVATHDIELLELLDGEYAPVHFREQVSDGQLTFDYRLRPGASSTRNAIKVLSLMQYPDSVVTRANATVEMMEHRAGSIPYRSPPPSRPTV
jgi:hypothetical protein